MKWPFLIASIFCEVTATSALKLTSLGGPKAVIAGIVTAIFYVLCFWFMRGAMRYFDLGVLYSTWCGLGIALVAVIGFMFFGDSMSVSKVFFLMLIILGIVGLNLTGTAH